jgi:hypothetical protein
MNLINQKSLGETLNNFYDSVYAGKKIPAADKKKLAVWISSRQGIEGSYSQLPAPTEYDFSRGIRLYTGEKIDMIASISHISGEEALRALYMLDVKDSGIVSAINKSKKGINSIVNHFLKNGSIPKGWYCCGKCTAAYWRNLSAEGVDKNKSILNAGIKILNKMRDGKGKWHRFPFYYTVMSLTGIDLPAAKAELAYAEAGLVRMAGKTPKDKFSKRRKFIAEKALEMI